MEAKKKVRLVPGILILFVWLLVTHQAISQTWRPEFRVRVDYRPITMINAGLHEFLQFGHKQKVKGCNTRVSVFYFRINSQGMVDSLYCEGNFTDEEKDTINRNILNTSGNWFLPPNTTSSDHCWFVYPCFVLGQLTGACSEDPGNQRQIEVLRKLYFDQIHQFDSRGRYRLPPNVDMSLSQR